MPIVVEPLHARARPDDEFAALFADGWPAFITADRIVSEYIDRVRTLFVDLELAVMVDGVLAATGWGVPIVWDLDPAHLPSGYTDALVRSVVGAERGEPPNAFVIAAAQVHPERRGTGLAGVLLRGLRDLAAERGWDPVIAPVRPTLKARYPLTSIERFAGWTRPDGLPLDPWIRTHWRLGARMVALAPTSQTFTGTVGDWESWTGLVFPDSGDYVIPDGLALLRIERDGDTGTYVEPNVWMRHR